MKIIKFLFSGAFMGILLLVFAYAIGYATFVGNDYGAVAAKVLTHCIASLHYSLPHNKFWLIIPVSRFS